MFFLRFLLGNLFCSLLVGLLFLMKQVGKGHITPRFRYRAWFLLVIALGIAFLPTAFWKGLSGERPDCGTPSVQTSESGPAAIRDAVPDWQPDQGTWDVLTENTGWQKWFAILWAVGVIGTGAYFCLGWRRLNRVKRLAYEPDAAAQRLFAQCRSQLGLQKPVGLLQSDSIPAPMGFGCTKTYILLPSGVLERCSQQELAHIFLHEQMHIRHRDTWGNMLFCGIRMLCWFNPCIWLAISAMELDREAYCDWDVLNLYDSPRERLHYGQTLLHVASQTTDAVRCPANGFLSRKQHLKYRIMQIADFQPERKSARWLCRGLAALLLGAMLVQIPAFSALAGEMEAVYQPPQDMKLAEEDYSGCFGDFSGCAVVYSQKSDVYHVYGREQAVRRIAPASTCKPYSALNALEQGIISPDKNLLLWDHRPQPFAAWNGDQNLNSAMGNSVNWYFEELDRRAGAEALNRFYSRIGYGNGKVGTDTRYYWNGSSLKISPLEQVQLLRQLYDNGFGFQQANVDAVKESLFLAEEQGYRLYGKTGTGKIGANNVNGWFVGYLEGPGDVCFFAVNLKGEQNADGRAAMEVACAILKTMEK